MEQNGFGPLLPTLPLTLLQPLINEMDKQLPTYPEARASCVLSFRAASVVRGLLAYRVRFKPLVVTISLVYHHHRGVAVTRASHH